MIQIYITGALIVGTLKAAIVGYQFTNPRTPALDPRETLMYYATFILAFVLWPAEAIHLGCKAVGFVRAKVQQRRTQGSRYPFRY